MISLLQYPFYKKKSLIPASIYRSEVEKWSIATDCDPSISQGKSILITPWIINPFGYLFFNAEIHLN